MKISPSILIFHIHLQVHKEGFLDKNLIQQANILLLDDDEIVHKSIKRILPNYNIHSTYNLEEANNLLMENKYELFISDLKVGNDSGINLIKKIREKYKGLSDLKIIIITGYAFSKSLIELEKLNVYKCFFKPIKDLNGFVRSIESCLDSS